MFVAVDVCVLIGDGGKAISWLADRIRIHDDQILMDHHNGPCWRELQKHSPTPEGEALRRMLGDLDCMQIPKRVHEALMNLIRRHSTCHKVANNGEPKGALRGELRALVEERGLEAWWESDRKWVSLCQQVAAADLLSFDGGFHHAAAILEKHGIRVFPGVPVQE